MAHREPRAAAHAQQAEGARRDRAEPGLELGHHVPARGACAGPSSTSTSSSTSGAARSSAASVHEEESMELARALVTRACAAERRRPGTARAALRQRRPDEGLDDARDAPAARHRRLLQPPERERRQPLLRGALPHAEVPARATRASPSRRSRRRARGSTTFVAWYNSEHLHSAIRFVTPEDRHEGRDVAILAARRDLYAKREADDAAALDWRHAQLDASRDCHSQPGGKEPSGLNSIRRQLP